MLLTTTKSQWLNYLIGTIIYFFWFGFIVGIHIEHILIFIIYGILFFSHSSTRKFILAFSIFLIYFAAYDSLRAFPNYTLNSVSIEEIYNIEKYLFGISYLGNILTPSEYLDLFIHPVLDIIAGSSYVLWVPAPMSLAIYLYIKKSPYFKLFAYAFVATNLIGFGLYYVYPAAPPWYVVNEGFNFVPGLHGEAAGLARFDQLISYPLYEGIYSKNASVYAAVPSIHCANPTVCLIFAVLIKKPKMVALFSLITLGIWFAAVYSFHHYLFDVLAGALLALVVTISVYYLYLRSQSRQLDFEK